MSPLPLLALLLSSAAQAQTAPPQAPAPVDAATQAAPPSPVVRRVDGKVTFATATTAYIDAGALEGVAIGQVVRLTRAAQPSGSCTIRETADHSSTCTGEGIRAGDRFAFETTLPGAPAVAKMAPVPTEEELDSRNAIVTGTPVALVEAKAQPRDVVLGQLPTVRGDLGYAVWLASPSGAGDSQRLQLDIQVNGLDAFAGFRFFADARLMQWTQRNETYVPGSSTQLLVYDLELAQRDPKKSWSASFGRVMPWFAPGSTVFDGAQGGLRFGRTEIGIFGGTVPDTYTTEPTFDRYTGGVYANFEAPLGSTLLSGSARAAVVQNPAVLRHYEGELLLNYWAGGVFSASGDLRMGFGDVHAPSYIDSARLALSIRPVPIFWISGGFSYWGLTMPNDEPIATYPGPSRRADGSVGVDATDWLRIAALGGWVDDLTSVRLPHLRGARGHLHEGAGRVVLRLPQGPRMGGGTERLEPDRLGADAGDAAHREDLLVPDHHDHRRGRESDPRERCWTHGEWNRRLESLALPAGVGAGPGRDRQLRGVGAVRDGDERVPRGDVLNAGRLRAGRRMPPAGGSRRSEQHVLGERGRRLDGVEDPGP